MNLMVLVLLVFHHPYEGVYNAYMKVVARMKVRMKVQRLMVVVGFHSFQARLVVGFHRIQARLVPRRLVDDNKIQA